MKSGGFHEIWQISHEIDGFHHEIWQISPWNLVDFTMKSSGFHEICEIHEIWWISPWNLADFMKSGRFQVKSDVSEIRCRCFSKTLLNFYKVWVISPEIRWISCEIERPLQGIVTLCFCYVTSRLLKTSRSQLLVMDTRELVLSHRCCTILCASSGKLNYVIIVHF